MVATTICPDLTILIEEIILNHYSHDLHRYYETTINYNLQPNYTTFVLYNILEYPMYHLGVVVPGGTKWHMCGG